MPFGSAVLRSTKDFVDVSLFSFQGTGRFFRIRTTLFLPHYFGGPVAQLVRAHA